MELLMHGIDLLKNLEQGIQLRELLSVARADPDRFALLVLYAAAMAWLVNRSRRSYGPPSQGHLSGGVAVADGLLRFMIAVVLLGLSVMLALGRAAGRSHYRW